MDNISNQELYCSSHQIHFSCRSAYNVHMRDKHNLATTIRQANFHCVNCEETFSSNSKRIEHLIEFHNEKIETDENLLFESYESALGWKGEEELRSSAFFRANRSTKLDKNGDRVYYCCNRNPLGNGMKRVKTDDRQRRQKSTPFIHLDRNLCPSMMIIERKTTNNYILTYVKTHLGHDSLPVIKSNSKRQLRQPNVTHSLTDKNDNNINVETFFDFETDLIQSVSVDDEESEEYKSEERKDIIKLILNDCNLLVNNAKLKLDQQTYDSIKKHLRSAQLILRKKSA